MIETSEPSNNESVKDPDISRWIYVAIYIMIIGLIVMAFYLLN